MSNLINHHNFNYFPTDRGSLLSDLRTMISGTLSIGFEKFELELVATVGNEVRSENIRSVETKDLNPSNHITCRQTSTIMTEISTLSNLPVMTRNMATNIESMHTFLTEHHEGTAMASEEISKSLKTISTTCLKNRDSHSKIQNMAAGNASLLNDLKVFIFSH